MGPLIFVLYMRSFYQCIILTPNNNRFLTHKKMKKIQTLLFTFNFKVFVHLRVSVCISNVYRWMWSPNQGALFSNGGFGGGSATWVGYREPNSGSLEEQQMLTVSELRKPYSCGFPICFSLIDSVRYLPQVPSSHRMLWTMAVSFNYLICYSLLNEYKGIISCSVFGRRSNSLPASQLKLDSTLERIISTSWCPTQYYWTFFCIAVPCIPVLATLFTQPNSFQELCELVKIQLFTSHFGHKMVGSLE